MATKDDILTVLNALVLKVGELTRFINELKNSDKIVEKRENTNGTNT